MRRCEDKKMWRWADVKMSRCEDEKMWRWEDVKMSRCEDEKMWEKVWRLADVREGVKMSRCEDEKMWEKVWRWEDEIQTPTIGRTLRSDALGKKRSKKIPAHSGKNQKQVLAFLALYGALLYSTGNMYNASVWKKNSLNRFKNSCLKRNNPACYCLSWHSRDAFWPAHRGSNCVPAHMNFKQRSMQCASTHALQVA